MGLDQGWPEFLDLVRRDDAAEATFGYLSKRVRALIGTRLLTASVFDMKAGQSRRVYSENVDAYPVGGFKEIASGTWADTVLQRQEVFSTLRIEQIAEVFFDWKLIQSLGCESNANIPVVVAGEVIGTLNLLHEAGYYTAERLARADELLPIATIAFLLAARATPAPTI